MNVLFEMETGDPDDLITLLLLLANPNVQLRGINCWQGSPAQIGLINYVLSLADLNIPVGGLNSPEPAQLSAYYRNIVGYWKHMKADINPNEVLDFVLTNYPDTHILTGAPLTNLGNFVEKTNKNINKVTTQGGYLGEIIKNPIDKFKNVKSIRTYNLSSDTEAFLKVDKADCIKNLTYVTKDLCHDFLYTPSIHNTINFGSTPLKQFLKRCLEHYANQGKEKAMHDSLAMLYMLSSDIGTTIPINMQFKTNSKGHSLFYSTIGDDDCNRYGLINYDKNQCWNTFKQICE